MPPNVAAIFRRACHNCHSEQTDWLWYSSVAPIHWLLAADVYGARERMNLSRWGRYTPEERTERLIGICEMVAGNRMPLWYYKPLHYPDAWLSEADRRAVCDWVKRQVHLAIPFIPQNDTERQVAATYSKLETTAHARDSAAFGPMLGDEFVAVSSNSDKLQTKRSRMEEFDRAKDGGLAPTPLVSARMQVFGDAVLMTSEHKPDRGNPLHVTRLWVRRNGTRVETLSYQTARER